jgi:hypothetical protein
VQKLEYQVSTYRDIKTSLEEERNRLQLQVDTLSVQVTVLEHHVPYDRIGIVTRPS